jgi:Holliday junction resolvase RusA-like endonuclease
MVQTEHPGDERFFDYVVYGRPVSTQPESRGSGQKVKKSSNLPKWRDTISTAINESWETYSKDFFIDFLRLDLLWIYDAKLPNDPDLDNIVKPFIDRLESRLYQGDEAFREIHLHKSAVGEPWTMGALVEKLQTALGSQREFVYVRVSPLRPDIIRSLDLVR